jgi:hypothetical protein
MLTTWQLHARYLFKLDGVLRNYEQRALVGRGGEWLLVVTRNSSRLQVTRQVKS